MSSFRHPSLPKVNQNWLPCHRSQAGQRGNRADGSSDIFTIGHYIGMLSNKSDSVKIAVSILDFMYDRVSTIIHDTARVYSLFVRHSRAGDIKDNVSSG